MVTISRVSNVFTETSKKSPREGVERGARARVFGAGAVVRNPEASPFLRVRGNLGARAEISSGWLLTTARRKVG